MSAADRPLPGRLPRVSIVIPVYNLRRFVGEAIESALAQTLPPEHSEIIVVDDGSTDGSAEVVQRYRPRVTCLRQENRGLSAARNAGLRAARGEFIAFLDADDRLAGEKVAAQLAVFDGRPDVGLVYTGVRYIDERGAELPQVGWYRREGDVFADLVLGNRIHPHVALVRREAVEAVGGFDETLTSAEDWDVWLRLARRGVRWACVDRPLADYRIRPDAMHQNPGRMADNTMRVLAKVFADAGLPPAIAALEPLAYQRACLVAAADHYRTGDATAGARWFRAAADSDPSFLTDPEALRRWCRWLLPLGHQRGTVMIAELPRLSSTLRTAVAALFAAPDLPPNIGRLGWRARVAAWRALLPIARKRAWAAMRRRRSEPRPVPGL